MPQQPFPKGFYTQIHVYFLTPVTEGIQQTEDDLRKGSPNADCDVSESWFQNALLSNVTLLKSKVVQKVSLQDH